jgi:hypothetical protein
MNIEYIKVGETYLLPVTATSIEKHGWLDVATTADYGYHLAPSEVRTLLQNSTKNTENVPKYDPCREYKEGDVVRYKPCNGREHKSFTDDEFFCDGNLTVIAAEDSTSHNVMVMSQDGRTKIVEFCYLELITPVEEMEPYSVREYDEVYEVQKGLVTYSVFYKVKYGENAAKAAAEAERDRLNSEYRKGVEK